MDTGLLAALVFAAAIVVLAVVLTRLTRPRHSRDRRRDDGRERTSDAVAKSIAIGKIREDGDE